MKFTGAYLYVELDNQSEIFRIILTKSGKLSPVQLYNFLENFQIILSVSPKTLVVIHDVRY